MKKLAILVVLAFGLLSLNIAAGEYSKEDKKEMQEHSESASFKGQLVCLGCELKVTDNARASCSAYGHKHGLKTADGKYISFLENEYSQDLIKGEKYHNKKMEVEGVYFAKANLLDVESFQVDGEKKTWCGSCKSMDACSAK